MGRGRGDINRGDIARVPLKSAARSKTWKRAACVSSALQLSGSARDSKGSPTHANLNTVAVRVIGSGSGLGLGLGLTNPHPHPNETLKYANLARVARLEW